MVASEAGIFLFLICVLAAIVIVSMNILAESFPILALAVGLFCLALLAVLIIVMVASIRNIDTD